jgi:hypothetical protein
MLVDQETLMTMIYTVSHLDMDTENDDTQEKLIGVYSTQDLAERAIARLRDKPGFRDYSEECWFLSPHRLDDIVDYWDEGFL